MELKEIISSKNLNNFFNQTYSKKHGAKFNEKYSESYLWRYALYMSSRSCYLLENDKTNETAILSLKMAAEIYENLYYISDEYDQDYSLLLSSLCYDLSGYQANAKCLIDELEVKLGYYSLKSDDELNNLENLFLKTIQLFLQKKIYLLNEELIKFKNINLNNLPSSFYENFLKYYINLLENLIDFIFEGDEDLIEIIKVNSQNAYKSILYSGNVLMSHLMHLFNVRLEIFFEKNIWTNIGKYIDTCHPLWNKFIKLKTKDYYSKFEIKDEENRQSIMEFWNSQLNALNVNIIGKNQNNENYIIKMPTSAGKTFISEILLLNSFIENENSKAIYITPYLSLTNEINESLSSLEKLGFTLSNMTKSYEIDEYEELWVEEADVLIATPEKIDLLYRNEKEFFNDVSIIIVDEGHIVGDNGKRSVLVELLISKLKVKLETTRFIFVSAMMTEEDTKYLSEWITQKEHNVLESPKIGEKVWEPTRRLVGFLDYNNNKGHIKYLENGMYVPNIIKQNNYHYINPNTNRENNKKFPQPDSKSDISVELAYSLISEGNILIFTSQPQFSVSIGKSFLNFFNLKNLVHEEIDSKFKSNEELHSLFISEKLLGEDHLVTKCLRYNIGIHNGDLPEELRKNIELDFRSKKLKVLVATNTISHGINFPIKNTIIHALNFNKDNYISKRDFWNLVGRTGRAGKETEGKILFIVRNQNDKDRFDEYTDRVKIENINSRLLEIIQEIIAKSSSDLDDKYIQEEIEPVLFDILIEESIDSLDENVIENTLKNSLFYVQSDYMEKECLFKRLKHSGNVFYSEIVDKDLRTIYSKTGLTLKSNKSISHYVLENLVEFNRLIQSNDVELFLEHIFNLFPNLKEMDNNKLKNENEEINFFTENKDFLIGITKKWIDGESIENLINSWKDYFDDDKIHAFLNHSLQYNFSWGIHSLLEILIYHLNNEYGYKLDKKDDLPDNIKNLSSYVKYGLNNPEACKCKNLGIENRETCIKLVNEYFNKNDSNWFFNIEYIHLKNNPNFNGSEKKEVIQILQEKNYNQKQFDELLEKSIDVSINSNELDVGSILYLERDLTDNFNLYKIDLKYENNIVGSLPINYSKALAIEMDLNNVKLFAIVKNIKDGRVTIIIEKDI